LNKYGQKDTILAGFHTDLNFLTIHGRSRYPGLHIWARNTGNRIAVKIPPGNYLLVQAGKQLEHITGGLIKAGFHEVIVNEKTIETIEKRKHEFPDRPLVRISSTLFWHLGSDVDLTPVPKLAARAKEVRERQKELGRDEGREAEYPPMKVGHQVQACVNTPLLITVLVLIMIQRTEAHCFDDLIVNFHGPKDMWSDDL
jgi:isopenicillin N synthase-like dioxygenase